MCKVWSKWSVHTPKRPVALGDITIQSEPKTRIQKKFPKRMDWQPGSDAFLMCRTSLSCFCAKQDHSLGGNKWREKMMRKFQFENFWGGKTQEQQHFRRNDGNFPHVCWQPPKMVPQRGGGVEKVRGQEKLGGSPSFCFPSFSSGLMTASDVNHTVLFFLGEKSNAKYSRMEMS